MRKKDAYTLADFPMPKTIDLEKQILAGVINASDLLLTARHMLTPEDFSSEETRELWTMLCGMEDACDSITLPSVFSKYGGCPLMSDIVGMVDIPCTDTGMASLARALHTASLRMRVYFQTMDLFRSVTSPESDETEILAQLGQMVDGLTKDSLDDDIVTFSEALVALKEEIAKRKRGEIVCVPSGITKLDVELHGGFEPDELIILAARPSVGKTALMLQMLKGAAMCGVPSMVFSLEMSNSALTRRLVTSTGVLNSWQLATGNMGEAEYQYATSMIESLPIRFCDNAYTIDQIESKLIRAHQRGEAGFALIDYLGLIAGGKGVNVTQQVSDVTRRLKLLAKKLHIPILLLSQLNRSAASEGRSPQLYDLRDSGSIEQDADMVLMLENPSKEFLQEYFPEMSVKHGDDLNEMVLMWVRKVRRGRRDSAILFEVKNEYTRFEEVSSESEGKEDLPF